MSGGGGLEVTADRPKETEISNVSSTFLRIRRSVGGRDRIRGSKGLLLEILSPTWEQLLAKILSDSLDGRWEGLIDGILGNPAGFLRDIGRIASGAAASSVARPVGRIDVRSGEGVTRILPTAGEHAAIDAVIHVVEHAGPTAGATILETAGTTMLSGAGSILLAHAVGPILLEESNAFIARTTGANLARTTYENGPARRATAAELRDRESAAWNDVGQAQRRRDAARTEEERRRAQQEYEEAQRRATEATNERIAAERREQQERDEARKSWERTKQEAQKYDDDAKKGASTTRQIPLPVGPGDLPPGWETYAPELALVFDFEGFFYSRVGRWPLQDRQRSPWLVTPNTLDEGKFELTAEEWLTLLASHSSVGGGDTFRPTAGASDVRAENLAGGKWPTPHESNPNPDAEPRELVPGGKSPASPPILEPRTK